MAKKEMSEKSLYGDELSARKRNIQNASRKGFHAGDLLLVLLAILMTALLIFFGAEVLPSIRKSFTSYTEELLFTVEHPISSSDELPLLGDHWVLLDSDGAVCTVQAVEPSEDGTMCRVTLLRKNAIYRDGEGYTIEEIRIAIGSTLYFRSDPDRYFAASVLTLDSDRFAYVSETEEKTETDDATGNTTTAVSTEEEEPDV